MDNGAKSRSLSYFETPEFHDRMKKLNEDMMRGMRPNPRNMGRILGCSYEDFMNYVNLLADERGVAFIPVGGGQTIRIDVPPRTVS